MSFRSIIIQSRSKLEYSLNYLVVNKGSEVKRILLDDIKLIVIDTMQVSMTSALISECLNKKIKICFSNQQHNLIGEITPYKNNYYSKRKLKEQLLYDEVINDYLWQLIVKEKLINQARNVSLINDKNTFDLIKSYMGEVKKGDSTNREGLAAKAYFRSIFGTGFTRDNEFYNENKYLNYGYSIILSSFNRAIKSLGYYTELGIHHNGDTNSFNLSCDFMEPLRPLVDSLVIKEIVNEDNFKLEFINLLSKEVIYRNRKCFLDNAIEDYCEDLFSFLRNGVISEVDFIKYEL